MKTFWLQHLKIRAAGLTVALVVSAVSRADVSVPSIFGSNMVLQCDVAVPVWGKASPGEKIQIEFQRQLVETIASADGSWRANLPPLATSAISATLKITGSNKLEFTNVLVGEVWLCSGQSNMTLPVKDADHATEEIAAAKFPRIRLFTVERSASQQGPEWNCKGHWVQCSPEEVGGFTAVGYYFGRDLHRNLNRPVGLIHSSWGGTKAEAWTPRDAMPGDQDFAAVLEHWKRDLAESPKKIAEFEANKERLVAEWKVASAKAKELGRMPPSDPRPRFASLNPQYGPCGLYNAMIAPLVPFALRGVIWYQGEANVGASKFYQRLFPAMIASWRKAWNAPALPFLYVQLPNLARQPEPSRSGWAEMREAQLKTLAVAKTAMVVTIDVGDPQNLHPKHKQPVGIRLAMAANALVYGASPEDNLSPVLKEFRLDPKSIRVEFAHADRGLTTKGGEQPSGFSLAGTDRIFKPARAEIEGAAVILTSDEVPNPVAARYAWADNPTCNLVARSNLPASPFRTDDWPTPATSARSKNITE